MNFVDQVRIQVAAGAGGSGTSSFARFKYVPKGGPDGGDGGNGGNVFVTANANLTTLLDYRYRTSWKAERGVHGKGKNQTGATGDDVILPVPPGTIIRDVATGEQIGEVLRSGDSVMVAKGGRGGRGNARFATSTHRAPREWEPGEGGEAKELEFELKLIADVGLVGEPNAGKSTLLSVVSAARPKIADYPFTTLEPNLGVVSMGDHRTFVVADIPGIIEGAHRGKGLGLQFLRHVERTRVLAFMVPLDAEDPQAIYEGLRREVKAYSEPLFGKPHFLVLTKRDLFPTDEPLPTVSAPDSRGTVAISAVAGFGLDELKRTFWHLVESEKALEGSDEVELDVDGFDPDQDG